MSRAASPDTEKNQTSEINANNPNKSEHKLSSPDCKQLRSKSKDDGEVEIRTISDIIGNWGPYQSRLFALYFAMYIIAPIQNLGVIFYTDNVDHKCKIPDNVDKVIIFN